MPSTPLSLTTVVGALVALATLIAVPVLSSAPAAAADIPVTSPDDDGPDTLRQAVATANALGGEDAIVIAPSVGSITLHTPLSITEGVVIRGNGTTLTRDSSFDLVVIDLATPGAVTLDDLALEADAATTHGRAVLATSAGGDDLTISNTTVTGFHADDDGPTFTLSDNEWGGAVKVGSGRVQVADSTFANNSAHMGGSALWIGEVTADSQISGSVFRENATYSLDGRGGSVSVDSIAAGATLHVTESYFVGNTTAATRRSGFLGIALSTGTVEGTLLVDSSTFDHQIFPVGDVSYPPVSGWSVGVARVAPDGTVRVVNSTFDEDALGAYGLLYVLTVSTIEAGGSYAVDHSTIVGGGTLLVGDNRGVARMSNTIAEGLVAPDAITVRNGAAVEVQYSLLSTALNALHVVDGGGNRFGVDDMMLQPLADNGGRTPTMLIGPIGPAVGTGNPVASTDEPTLEQRGAGYLRRDGLLDIGAVELPETLPTLPLPPTPATPGIPSLLAATGSTAQVGLIAVAIALLGGGAVALSGARTRRAR